MGSTLAAGAIGALIMMVISKPLICGNQCDTGPLGPYLAPATGFLIGAGVQIGVRVVGVS